MRDTSPPNQQAFYEQVWSFLSARCRAARWSHTARSLILLPPPEEMDLDTYQALSPRWVGSAMAACPNDVPWQRVINAQGKMAADWPGAQRQRQLLEQEGIVFVKDKVNLKVYQWRGPGWEDEPRQAEQGIVVE